jgi:hypothetical protein
MKENESKFITIILTNKCTELFLETQQFYKHHQLLHVAGLTGLSSGNTIIALNDCLIYWSLACIRTTGNSSV